jgi:hypothetical protein
VDIRSCYIFVITAKLLDESREIFRAAEIAGEIGTSTLRSP